MAKEPKTGDIDAFMGDAPDTTPKADAKAAPKTGDIDAFLPPLPATNRSYGAGDPETGSSAIQQYIPPAAVTLGSGIKTGLGDIAQTVDQWGNKINALVPGSWLINPSIPGMREASAQVAADTAAAEKANAGDPLWAAGRVGGNIVGSMPFLYGPEAIIGRGVQAFTNATGLTPAVGRAVQGAIGGGTAAGGTAALSSGPSGQNPLAAFAEAAPAGAALGAAGPVAAGVGRAMFGGGREALEGIAGRLGIDLTTGQRVGGIAQRVEDATATYPFSGAGPAAARQREQLTNVIERNMGETNPTGHLDTAALNNAETRIGNAIDNATRQITVPGNDPTLINTLGQIEANARLAGATTPEATATRTLIDRFLTTVANRGGNMPGADFQRFIARGGELDSAINSSNPEVARAARAIREALLDAGERGGQGSAQAIQDLQQARYQWKVTQTARDAIDKTTGSGDMSLPKLAQSIRREFNMKQTGQGADMQDLARVIDGVKPLPSSGTAERLAWMGLAGLGVGGVGGGGYYAWQHPEDWEQAAWGLAPAAAGLLAGRYLRSGFPTTPLNPLIPRIAGAAAAHPEWQQPPQP